ncbi:phosphatase [Brevundimonas sp. LM2]|uniref:PhoX family protein n=1 Tax=Brevundimonas sp. LM2 TaxID=1938605 RepID=UPI000983D3C5|nr:PhoX family phosphatase [Brevundimonas sp. LM2]AQR61016.1 phosphatase [Brevundimonas sp. LM2]
MSEIHLTGSHDDGDVELNVSSNPTFASIIEQRQSRRGILGGMASVAALFGLAGCDDDGDGRSGSEATITAGTTGATNSGRLVTLTGTASGTTSVQWVQESGPTVVLTNANTNTATFIAPSVTAATNLVFSFNGSGGNGVPSSATTTVAVSPATLGFTSIAKNFLDVVTVPAGYSVNVLYRLGDPINTATAAYANNGTDTGFANRAGDHHDGMSFFGLGATSGLRDDTSSARGLLVLNHENITETYLHPNGPTTVAGARPEAEAIKEIECHGVSVIEVLRGTTGWSYVQNSTFNRRITPNTPMDISGPVRGDAAMVTAYSPTGVAGRGTINNCANGYTPWGTYLTCEENWAGYFRRSSTDNASRTAKEIASLSRYGVSQGAGGANNWASVTPSVAGSTVFAKWNASVLGANAAADFRNEPNQYGWVVEIDPFDVNSVPRKRTALGRMGHEGAWPANFVAGRRPVFYMGDDNRGDYFYKFVSATAWSAADATATNRLAIGDKYLDNGTLYVARFDASGSGTWLPLVFGQGFVTSAYAPYSFSSQADVLINARHAADAAGATKMDRPEWAAINPANGEVYLTLTNTNASSRPLAATDAANPRHYNDPRGAANTAQYGNPNGHIIRLRETGNTPEAVTFTWDIYAFGADSALDATNINLSGLDATNDFSSPDGLWFGRPQNASGLANPLLWIQTDDGAFTDKTNNQMLVAQPGVVGDGGPRTITNTSSTGATRTQATIVGKAPAMTLRRFLVGPKDCEITGIDSTPDGRTIFVNIQHPGDGGSIATPTSAWPASQTSATAVARPRSSTIVITKDDGGVVGL